MKKIMYDVIIFTNRNYGLYSAYTTKILGLNTCVLNISGYKEHKMDSEPSVWPNEQREDYLHTLKIMSIPIINLEYKDLFYSYMVKNELWKIRFFHNEESLYTKNIIFALSNNHILGGAKTVTIDDFQFKNGLYIIGENAFYGKKIHAPDIYTGEANLVAQQIYKKIHSSTENITVHSTEKIF